MTPPLSTSSAIVKEKAIRPKTSKNTSTSTVIGKIIGAIRGLKEPGTKGSSRSAITKYIKSEYEYDNATALKKAFKKGVSDGVLVQTGQSFRVASDPIIEADVNDEEKLIIEELTSSSPKNKGNNGAKAQCGDSVTVSYRGTLDDGTLFDSSKNFEFVLGAGEVIKGWDMGIIDMVVGSKRKLIVPYSLGYGKRGSKPDIPPCARLTFVVTLKRIN